MFGNNIKLGPESEKDLKIHSIFSTIQGEGPYTGHQAIFVRLSGCNLACEFCDTDFDSYDLMSIDLMLKKIDKVNNYNAKLVVITGGEPLRQDITYLCQKLEEKSFNIQIETNGVFYRELPVSVKIVCSPKAINGRYRKIRDDILRRSIAIKFLISSHIHGYSDIYDVGQHKYNIPVYVQPMDEFDQKKNNDNLLLSMEIAKKNNAIFSLQMHKILKIQ